MINLKEVITKYPECLNNSTKLKGILIDLYPNERVYAKIIALLLENGIVNELKESNEIDSFKLKNLSAKIERQYGLSTKHVEGCLNIWATALNIKIKNFDSLREAAELKKKTTTKKVVGELHEHKYKKMIIPPTCNEKGYTLHTCECGYEYKDNYVNPEHKFVLIEYKESTCKNNGQEVYKCSECGEEKVDLIPALGHNWGNWIEKIKPTCTEHGIEERKCSRCGKVESRNTKKLGHRFTDWRIDGENKVRDCLNCGITQKINLAEEQAKEAQKQAEKQAKEENRKKEEEIKRQEAEEREKAASIGGWILCAIGGILAICGSSSCGSDDSVGTGIALFLIGGVLFFIGMFIAAKNT